ncbi:MAG TPA: cation:proton antiporter [Geminicoccus sp.]|uniref:cation:proton antiporter domain-containing protein n=1 Tax=Geminicoccus sp. TaxID=2024832 RepID=UPI002E34C9BD|nr:cation:proton antiporter [Geminicoccus sp.]HEX2527342.1 cation:proton antiporter [Geminicoccus sp.]
MSTYQFVALLLAGIGPVLALAGLIRVPTTLVLFALGLASAFLPGVPVAAVDPQLVLNLFLPPLLYASTVRVSWHLLRFTLVPGICLGALLVPATIGAAAMAARLLLPGLSWNGALLIGTVAAIFDTRLFHEAKGRPHVPRAIADTLKAREFPTRIIVLASFALLVETTVTGRFSFLTPLEHYGFNIPAGILIGFAIGYAIATARRHVGPAATEIAVSIATPYAAALAATALGVSAAAAIMTAALAVSAVRIDRLSGAPISSSETRINATAFWEEISMMVSSGLLFLAGHALPEALGALDDRPFWQLFGATFVLLLLVLGLQFLFSYASTIFQPVAGVVRGREPATRPSRGAVAALMAWSSTRSVIGLVIALSIPTTLPDGTPFPERDLILVVAALTIVGSVILQGLTLGHAVAGAALADPCEREREEEIARQAIEHASRSPGREHANGFDAARQALVRLREQDRIGDETMVRMLRETDLLSRAAEGDALPGSGPPNP